LESVYLYDIDDLQHIARENMAAREREIVACQALIGQHLQRFADWLDKNRSSLEERYSHQGCGSGIPAATGRDKNVTPTTDLSQTTTTAS
jgi:hypothetical protein